MFILYKNFKEKSKKTAERQAIERYADGGIFREKSKVILHIALCVGSIAANCVFDFAVIVRIIEKCNDFTELRQNLLDFAWF